MFKSILNTFGTRLISALATFILLIFSARYLGASGNGIIGILLTCIGLLVMVNGFAGGSAIVFLLPQRPNRKFLLHTILFSYSWSLVTCSSGCFILDYLNYMPHNLIIHGIFIGFLACNSLFHSLILLAKEKITEHNLTNLLQVIINSLLFILISTLKSQISINTYIMTLYFGYSISYLYSLQRIYHLYQNLPSDLYHFSFIQSVKHIFYYCFISQLSNLIQFLNYRLSVFVLNRYIGEAEIGIFYLGIRLSEAIWMISSSISLVLYSKIANSNEHEYNNRLTINLAKLSFLATLISAISLIIIPVKWITLIFGAEFPQVHQVIFLLSPGIVCFSISGILSHYFAGNGKYQINTYANLCGLVFTLTGNLLLIPTTGIIGASVVSSISYIANTIFLLLIWRKYTHRPWSDFLIKPNDIRQISELFHKKIKSWI